MQTQRCENMRDRRVPDEYGSHCVSNFRKRSRRSFVPALVPDYRIAPARSLPREPSNLALEIFSSSACLVKSSSGPANGPTNWKTPDCRKYGVGRRKSLVSLLAYELANENCWVLRIAARTLLRSTITSKRTVVTYGAGYIARYTSFHVAIYQLSCKRHATLTSLSRCEVSLIEARLGAPDQKELDMKFLKAAALAVGVLSFAVMLAPAMCA